MGRFTQFVRYKGQFDYHGLYTLMKSFFTSRDYDWFEKRYKDKGAEAEVNWVARRDYDEYHKLKFKVSYHMWDYEKIEVEERGKKKTVVKARIQISIDPDREMNYSGIYGKGKVDSWLKKIHEKVTEREEDEHWDTVMLSLAQEFVTQVKKFLGAADT